MTAAPALAALGLCERVPLVTALAEVSRGAVVVIGNYVVPGPLVMSSGRH